MSTSTSPSRLKVSTSHSRSTSREQSASSVPYLPQIGGLILPDGPVDENTTELLREFVHPHRHDTEDTLISNSAEDNEDSERTARARLPWWKRPAPWWLMVALPFAAIANSATTAPRIELYTIMACNIYKPEYLPTSFVQKQPALPYFDDNHFSFATRISAGTLATLNERALVSTNTGLWQNTSITPALDAPYETGGASQRCASDPEVQAAVAELTAVMTATMGIISCITTVWWGSLSDRYGRTRIMGISMLGTLFMDANLLFVAHFIRMLPGGYWFLLLGPIIEGLVGGMTAGTAAMHAYVSDTTDPGSQSRAFSLFLGVLFTGVAVGPTIGALIIRLTHNVLSVFYVATMMHLIYATFVWFIIPESLSRNQMAASRDRHQEELTKLREEREGVVVGVLVRIKRIFGFLSPLAILVPHPVEGGNPLKCRKRDWNLTLVAAAYGFTIMTMGSFSYIFQYAASTFSWSSEIIGYYISVVGATRAVHLVLVLPLAIKLLKPKPPAIQLPPDTDTDHLPPVLPPKGHHSPSFDLNIARVSLIVEVISFAFVGLSNTPVAFTLFTMLGSFGVGFSPGVHSVALYLYTRRGEKDNGRLFGALSVVQGLCSQIIGPAVFGFTFIRTVRVFPPAIFFLSSTTVFVSLVLLSLVRVPREACEEVADDAEDQVPSALHAARREDTLVVFETELDDATTEGHTKLKNRPATSNSLVDI